MPDGFAEYLHIDVGGNIAEVYDVEGRQIRLGQLRRGVTVKHRARVGLAGKTVIARDATIPLAQARRRSRTSWPEARKCREKPCMIKLRIIASVSASPTAQ